MFRRFHLGLALAAGLLLGLTGRPAFAEGTIRLGYTEILLICTEI
jgi:hypothetical protein